MVPDAWGRRRRAGVGLATVACVVLTACGAPAVDVTASPVAGAPTTAAPPLTPMPTPSPTPVERFPLTGEPTDDARLDMPAMAAKIDNNPRAFPHTGLDRADLVYEEVVEGGLTRLMPIFHSDIPEVVGPIRSGRFIDLEVLSPSTPILVFAGARPEVMSALTGSDAIGIVSDAGTSPFFRDRSRSAPHNLYFDAPAVYEIGQTRDEVGPVTTGFVFGDAPDGGTEATDLDIAMTYWQTTSWEWDAGAEVYRRSTRGNAYVVTGEGRVGAANVLVVLTTVSRLRAGDPYMRTELAGEGDAVLLRDGMRHDIRWRKADTTSHLEFVSVDGTPFPLSPGPSWIHLAPIGAVD